MEAGSSGGMSFMDSLGKREKYLVRFSHFIGEELMAESSERRSTYKFH
jgi:hypothetical protein